MHLISKKNSSFILIVIITLFFSACGGGKKEEGGDKENSIILKADAGTNNDVSTGTSVQLDGSNSSFDPNEQTIVYQWTLVSKPDGSSASLSDENIVNPILIVDVDGVYNVSLIINNGEFNSDADTIVLTASTPDSPSNTITNEFKPEADAGDDLNIQTNTITVLDGSNSSDADGNTLTYQWVLTTKPQGSMSEINNDSLKNASITPDVDGTYIISLVVSDDKFSSIADTVSIFATTPNAAPVANAGTAQEVETNTLVTLNGANSSGIDNVILNYTWIISDKPVGSVVVLSDYNIAQPTFTPDLEGEYKFNLIVNDGDISSDADEVIITVTMPLLQTIEITTSDTELTVGSQVELTLMASYSNGNILPVTMDGIWSSSKPAIAEVSNENINKGTVNALALGLSTITATFEGHNAALDIEVVGAKLVSIELMPFTNSIAVDTSQQFYATGHYSDKTIKNLTDLVTWRGLDDSILRVSDVVGSKGIATAIAAGNTNIEASIDTISASIPVSVTDVALQKIQVEAIDSNSFFFKNLPINTSIQMRAIAIFEDQSQQDISDFATWLSSDDTKAFVDDSSDSKGLVSGLAAGPINVQASWMEITGELSIDIKNDTLNGLSIYSNLAQIPIGFSDQFKARGDYSAFSTRDDLTENVIWSSADPSIAKVSERGIVLAKTFGTTTITAEFEGHSAEVTVEVIDVSVSSISITPNETYLGLGRQKNLSAIAKFSNDQTLNVTDLVAWNSANNTTAVISNAPGTFGKIYSIGEGTSEITATIGSSRASLTLTVKSEQCGNGDLPLTITDMDFPASVQTNRFSSTSVFGSITYSGNYSKIKNPIIATRLYTTGSTSTSYVTFPPPTVENCRINFQITIPEGISGDGSIDFKLVDYVSSDSDNWNNNATSNLYRQAVIMYY